MNWATDNHEEALQLFKSNISVYCEDEEITDDRKKSLKILRGIGDEGTRRLQVSGLSEEDKHKPDKLWEFFESQLKPKINFRVHRLHLMECRQREDETLDDFILRVRTLAMKCEFDQTEMEERLIELIIASTPLEDFQRDLLGKAKGYKLADALAEGRRYQSQVLRGRRRRPMHHRSAYLWEVEVGDNQLQWNQHNRRFISWKPKAGLPRPVWHPWGLSGSSPAAHQTGSRTVHRSSKKMLYTPWRTAKSRAGENG